MRTAVAIVAWLLVAVSIVIAPAARWAKGGPGGRYPLWGWVGMLTLTVGATALVALAATE